MTGLLDLTNDIKPWLNIEASNTKNDTTLTIINEAMCQAVINYTETKFALTVVTNEVLDANESDIIITDNMPIVSVQKLFFFVETDGSGGEEIETSDFQVKDHAIHLKHLHQPFRRSFVRVDYTYGFDGLPKDIKLMLLQAIEAEFRRKGRKALGISSRSKKDESETFKGMNPRDWDPKTGLPKELVFKLNFYKQSFEFPRQPIATRNK